MGHTKKDDKSVKSCVKKKCNPMIRKTARIRNKHFKGMDENIKKLKHAHNLKCSAGSKSNLNKIQCKNLKVVIETMEGISNKMNRPAISPLEMCKNKFCNKGCKDTLFEDGPPNKLSKGYRNILGNNSAGIQLSRRNRKKIFNNKTSVIKHNFYTGIPQERIKQLKKEGAISGCIY